MPRGRVEGALLVAAVLLLVVVPTAIHGWPTTWRGNALTVLGVAGALCLGWWRRDPRVASVLSLTLFLAGAAVGDGWLPDTGLTFFAAAFALLALGWSGRAVWSVAVGAVAYVAVFGVVSQISSWVAALMWTVPPFAAGTVLRLRRETAEQLSARARELEEERELYAEIALRHERARIASELHDIVGHAISVMVIQAAAGQRLVEADPARARSAFVAISESARQGTRDLERLLELLVDAPASDGPATDLALVDELVERAGRSGLRITCRFEGDRHGLSAPVAHLVYRVVQEGLTNALRYAPGAGIRVAVRVEPTDRALTVRVENDAGTRESGTWNGSGRGLIGLRERAQDLGGELDAGRTPGGGWSITARLPASPSFFTG